MSPSTKKSILEEINHLYEDDKKNHKYKYNFTEEEKKEYYEYLHALEKQFGNDLPGKEEETKFFERYLKTEILK